MHDRDDTSTDKDDNGTPAAPEAEVEESVDGTKADGNGQDGSEAEDIAEPDPEPVQDAEPADDATAGGPKLVEPELIEPEPIPEPTAEELLQAKLEQSSGRLRAVSKAYTDLQAEMTAFRERMENQAKFKAERQAFEQARAFFDPVQNLKRSLQNTPDDSPVKEGLTMVLSQFMVALKKLGMEEVPGVGAIFDPKVHEALALTPVDEAAQDGRVLVVHADGYTVNGKVLQAAQVVVGKYQEPAGEA